jgi:hypothetical protein
MQVHISRVARWSISYQKCQFGNVLDGPGLENVGMFYGHLVYFMANWYTYFKSYLVHFVAILVYFNRFGMLCQEKSGNPAYR